MRVSTAFIGLPREPESESDLELGTDVDRSGVTHPDGARYRALTATGSGAIVPVFRSAAEVAAQEARVASPAPEPAEELSPPLRPAGPTPLSDRPGCAPGAAPEPTARSRRPRNRNASTP